MAGSEAFVQKLASVRSAIAEVPVAVEDESPGWGKVRFKLLQTTLYNEACSFATAGQPEKSIKSLREAVSAGFHDLTHILKDEDLQSVRELPAFDGFLGEFDERAKSSVPQRLYPLLDSGLRMDDQAEWSAARMGIGSIALPFSVARSVIVQPRCPEVACCLAKSYLDGR